MAETRRTWAGVTPPKRAEKGRRLSGHGLPPALPCSELSVAVVHFTNSIAHPRQEVKGKKQKNLTLL